ncbi:MAG TPA: hypothetical protein VM864_11225 [Pyrinomonadaceae bacterium]|jgi:hypothetical protein|nr:hypothetical protein [Pyrinomonadaceae bacterium]
MRTLRAAVACYALLLSFAPDGAAQRRQSPPSRPEAPAPAAPRGSILTSSSNAEDGTTLVQFQPIPIEMSGGAQSTASFTASYTRTGAAQPTAASLVFFFNSQTCLLDKQLFDGQDGKAPDAELSVEGAPIRFKQIHTPTAEEGGEGLIAVSQETEGRYCSEGLSLRVKPETLHRIAAARNVTGSIGAIKFRLTPAGLSALRELGDQIKATAVRQ